MLWLVIGALGEFVTMVMEVLHLQITLYGNNYQLNFNNYLHTLCLSYI